MKRFLLLLFLLILSGPFLRAEDKVEEKRKSEKFSVSFWQFRAKGTSQTEIFGGISQPISFHLYLKGDKENSEYYLELDAVTNSTNGLRVVPGRNAYFGIIAKGFLWGIGRKSDPISFPAWEFWKDGVEGVFAESREGGFKVRFDLMDLYRGFPLLENQWLLLQGRREFLPDFAASELLSDTKSDSDASTRYRAGIQIFGTLDNTWVLNCRVRYLSLGNWGRFGSETKEARTQREIGDKDYLTEWKLGIGYLGSIFYFSADAFLSRGLDKTADNRFRVEKSIPISGEALRFDAGFYFPGIRISFFGFLPDREKRNSQGEILEFGFVGMGSTPLSNPILGQVWGFYPAAWVTGSGLEKEDTIYPGKKSAGLIGIQAEGKMGEIRFGVRYTYISFLDTQAETSGRWSLATSSFSKDFVREAVIHISWFPFQPESDYIRLDLGGFESQDALGLKQWFLLLRLGAVWE
ncbi:hypothetical protein EHQ27_09980 [Leptospira wolffii]|uniref:LA_2168 family protein n=1 Tax=Leptospira wolffii TaxID=409998 RepID=UPI0010834854|nr:hypothetical protein [Leptospira wolffii]TGK56805.1 hypothetical protein EHQ32_14550 [Leptospira wolffii]TGK71613.1 hypothetical protein EHQ27_09980 [Leptospira wolffii]TGK75530.1 hypothetical protein EHQ35_03925 [Leptospira wolffii]TGL32980.1 hypothetical protein EHQ57_00605 [Leptospira wolffii]